jgi:hypothetical protein
MIHIDKGVPCGGTKVANSPPIFFSTEEYFWLLSSRGANKKYEYCVRDKLGRVKTTHERLRLRDAELGHVSHPFTRRRLGTCESPVYVTQNGEL